MNVLAPYCDAVLESGTLAGLDRREPDRIEVAAALQEEDDNVRAKLAEEKERASKKVYELAQRRPALVVL